MSFVENVNAAKASIFCHNFWKCYTKLYKDKSPDMDIKCSNLDRVEFSSTFSSLHLPIVVETKSAVVEGDESKLIELDSALKKRIRTMSGCSKTKNVKLT